VTTPGPFLRWAGGKRRLLPVLHAAMPATFNRYYEPFLGGGALFFSLRLPGHRCVLNDFTPDLVAAYTQLRDHPEELITALQGHARRAGKDAYLELRATTPATDLEAAARFIALNRQSFNGLWRVNSRGQMNVPWGQLKNPTVCNEPLLRADAAALAGVTLRTGSYQDAVGDAGEGDFVYLDPPYLPASATSSFSKYAAGDFGPADHEQLARTITTLRERGALVMLSNSDTPLTRQIFADLDLYTVAVHRSISATTAGRGTVTEVLGLSYPLARIADRDTFVTLTR
jgi:DNA adenine methylase